MMHDMLRLTNERAGAVATPRMRTIRSVCVLLLLLVLVLLLPAPWCQWGLQGPANSSAKQTYEHIEGADPEGVLAGAAACLLQGDLGPGQFLVHRAGLLALHQQSGQETPESSCPAAAARQMRGACGAPTDPAGPPGGQHVLVHGSPTQGHVRSTHTIGQSNAGIHGLWWLHSAVGGSASPRYCRAEAVGSQFLWVSIRVCGSCYLQPMRVQPAASAANPPAAA